MKDHPARQASTADLPIRAAQMDISRVRETLYTIKKQIDLLADTGYNAIFLYLEWSVRCQTFDRGEAGYTPAEMREIIDYAATRGLQVIPGFATFGHSETLLEFPEFNDLAECREEGSHGRFGPNIKRLLCPSNPRVRKVIKDYLTEMADIFRETPWFHLGGDEAWDMGVCPDCKPKCRSFLGEEKLYRDHILFVHEVIRGLGKQVMMWDDMFELYPDILPDFPRDIIMVSWLYRENLTGFTGHFCNQEFYDHFAIYDKLGFRYLVAPADYCLSNIATYTAYAEQHAPYGALLTSWQKGISLLWKFMPIKTISGLLWSGKAQTVREAVSETCRKLFHCGDETLVNAICQYTNLTKAIPHPTQAALTNFPFPGPDNNAFYSLQTLATVLSGFRDELKYGRKILDDILADCTLKLLDQRSRRACWQAFHGMRHEPVENILDELEAITADYAKSLRHGRGPHGADRFLAGMTLWKQDLVKTLQLADSGEFLRIVFALPDQYSVQTTKISILDNHGQQHLVTCGIYKYEDGTYYECFFPLPQDCNVIKAVELSSQGFAGQGVAYLEIHSKGKCLVPTKVKVESGIVEHPEYLLVPNYNFAYFGERDVHYQMAHGDSARQWHSTIVTLKPQA